jgi:hypothetical protein
MFVIIARQRVVTGAQLGSAPGPRDPAPKQRASGCCRRHTFLSFELPVTTLPAGKPAARFYRLRRSRRLEGIAAAAPIGFAERHAVLRGGQYQGIGRIASLRSRS